MSQKEAVALYSGWRFLLKLNGLQPQDQEEKMLLRGIIRH